MPDCGPGTCRGPACFTYFSYFGRGLTSRPPSVRSAEMSADHVCRICNSSSGHKHFSCKEKLFGLEGEFAYFQCGACGCLQIAQVPADLGRFYPAHYYSFKPGAQKVKGWRQ